MKILSFVRLAVFLLIVSFTTLPAQAATTYSYDARHRLTGVAYANGRAIAYSYDATSNRLQKALTTGASAGSAGLASRSLNQTAVALRSSQPEDIR